MPGVRQSVRVAVVLTSAAVAVAIGGCGDDDEAGLAHLVPPDSPLYIEMTLLPDDGRTEAIASLSSKIAGIDDPRAQLTGALDGEFEAEGLPFTYAEDIEPWLGEAGAVFVRSFEPASLTGNTVDAALLLETTDEEAAQSFVEEATSTESGPEFTDSTYEDTDYRLSEEDDAAVGLVDGTLVVGTDASLKAAVDAAGNESLADDDAFVEHVGELDDQNVAELWLSLGTVLDAAAESSSDDAEIDAARAALGPLLSEPIAASVAVTSETVSVETSAAGGTPIDGHGELLAELPADAWFAVALAEAGDAVRATIDGLGALGAEFGEPTLDREAIAGAVEEATGLDLDEDVLSWIGDAAFYVAGTSGTTFNLGGLVEATDAEAATRVIEAGRDLFESQVGTPTEEPRLEGAEEGFAATAPAGQAFEVALRDGRVIAAMGGDSPAAAVAEPGQALADSPSYQAATEALGDGFAATAYVAIQDFLVVAEQGDDGDTDYDAASPYTRALDYLIFGTDGDGDRDLSRIVLGVGE